MLNKLMEVKKEIRTAPELSGVEVVEVYPDEIQLYFKPGTQRTGKELLKVQDILFNNNIFNFIKSEKVLLFENEIKRISISIY